MRRRLHFPLFSFEKKKEIAPNLSRSGSSLKVRRRGDADQTLRDDAKESLAERRLRFAWFRCGCACREHRDGSSTSPEAAVAAALVVASVEGPWRLPRGVPSLTGRSNSAGAETRISSSRNPFIFINRRRKTMFRGQLGHQVVGRTTRDPKHVFRKMWNATCRSRRLGTLLLRRRLSSNLER